MASIIARHENGVEAEPSSFDVQEQVDRYAPTALEDFDDEGDDDRTANETTLSNENINLQAPNKRQKTNGSRPSFQNADVQESGAPMFDLMPNAQPGSGMRSATPTPDFNTVMQFMQSMRDGLATETALDRRNGPTVNPAAPHAGTNGALQSLTSHPNDTVAGPPFQQDFSQLDFASLIDWDTSLANFQDERLLGDSEWNGDFTLDAGLDTVLMDDGFSDRNTFQAHDN